ncbi:hypothetical protein PORY_002682 [Pneumocystis oryctolagi]|uniref:Uncharacterized protein n=1 Tax=Pneumocystis oryctolagi TaxID=42067 RepID=A0ACB7CAK2_9ASCO|nr:hypothetical protein PORY_002682 [Pneumocystis oryctolagi]
MVLKALKEKKIILKFKPFAISYVLSNIRCLSQGKVNGETKGIKHDEKEKTGKNSNDKFQYIQTKKKSFPTQSGYIQWLADPIKCEKFKKLPPNPGRNFISEKNYPYPSNPTFKPPIPLSLSIKNDIGEKWKQGKSIREISEMFGISVVRVEAVLRLFELESKWRQDEKTLDSYAQTMHHMLGSVTNQTINEPSFFISIPSDTQNFITVPESSKFTPKDASDQLKRPLYSDIKEKLIQSQLNNSQYNEREFSSDEKTKVEAKETIELISKKSRFDLKVVDSYSGDIWIRSKEGVLTRLFWSNFTKYTKSVAQEKPHLFYSFCLGSLGPIIFLIVPPIRKKLGYIPPEPIPKVYPLPKRKREIITGYDD